MEEREHSLELVRRAALLGAASITRNRQQIADAVVRTIEKWEEALLRSKRIADPEAWAIAVAKNEAKSGGGEGSAGTSDDEDPLTAFAESVEAESGNEPSENRRKPAGWRRVVLATLARRKNLLRGRQFEVLSKLAEPGMSKNRAAKELGMDRANLHRSFKSGLARLRRRGN